MTELRVRNLDDWVVDELKTQAKAKGRSLEADLRERLRELVMRPRHEMAERTAQLRNAIAQQCGLLPDSVDAIREERDKR